MATNIVTIIKMLIENQKALAEELNAVKAKVEHLEQSLIDNDMIIMQGVL